MRSKGFLWTLVLATVLAGCARSAPQSTGYPGTEWAWGSSPESLRSRRVCVGAVRLRAAIGLTQHGGPVPCHDECRLLFLLVLHLQKLMNLHGLGSDSRSCPSVKNYNHQIEFEA